MPSATENPQQQEMCSTISTTSGSFPVEVMGNIFEELRDRVRFTSMTQTSFPDREDTLFTVGPLISITRVNHTWRAIALSSPMLWTSFPVLLENEKGLDIGNPGQVQYHLRHAADLPLSIIVGSRSQMTGSGVVIEDPDAPLAFEFFGQLVPRVRSLALAVEFENPYHQKLLRPEHSFSNLEKITVHGMEVAFLSLGHAGVWKSPRLRSVVWSIYANPHPPLLSPNWFGLTELLLSDSFEATIAPGPLRLFLSLATKLIRLQCRVGDVNSDDDDYGPTPLAKDFHQSPYPTLQHDSLQVLSLTFEGSQDECGSRAIPAILYNFHAPCLRTMSYRMSSASSLGPNCGISWLCLDNCHILTHFECLVCDINLQELLEGLKCMSMLETFRWLGIKDNSDRIGSTTSLPYFVGISPLNFADSQFLSSLSPPRSSLPSSQETPAPSVNLGMLCPRLRDMHVGFASFTNDGLKAFVAGRTGGRHLPSKSIWFSKTECHPLS